MLDNTNSPSMNAIQMETHKLAVLIGRRFLILEALYPNDTFSLTKLAEKIMKDMGNTSKYVDELEKSGLIQTEQDKGKDGRPYRKIQLTDLGRKILSTLMDASNESKPDIIIDPQKLEEYLKLLKSDNPKIQRYGAEEIERQSKRYFINDLEFITKIGLMIEEETNLDILKILLDAINNIILNSDHKIKRYITDKLKKPIMKLMIDTKEKKDTEVRIKISCIKILYELFTENNKYDEMKKLYIGFVQNGSKLISTVRHYLMTYHAQRIDELRIEIIKMVPISDQNFTEKLEAELGLLR